MTRAVIIAALILAAYLAAVIRFAVIAARRLRRGAPAPGAGDDALAVTCDPCNGRGGTWCKCPAKCASPACGAEDTGIGGWSPGELAYLRGETGELPHG